MSSTHAEHVGEGYYVTIQHCEKPDCDLFLGVNYPSQYCTKPFQEADHAPKIEEKEEAK